MGRRGGTFLRGMFGKGQRPRSPRPLSFWGDEKKSRRKSGRGSRRFGWPYQLLVAAIAFAMIVRFGFPDMVSPQDSADAEKRLGDPATQRLLQLVNSGEVTLLSEGRDEDRYGRKLRVVLVDGKPVGDTLVEEGLARWFEGGRRSWC